MLLQSSDRGILYALLCVLKCCERKTTPRFRNDGLEPHCETNISQGNALQSLKGVYISNTKEVDRFKKNKKYQKSTEDSADT